MNIARDLALQLYSLRAYRDLEAQLEALAETGSRLSRCRPEKMRGN